MSGIPNELPDLGNVTQMPRQNPEFVPGPSFSAEDYFVWSRCDGRTSIRDIILMVGLGSERGGEILVRLRRSGALLLPGETPRASPPRPAADPGAERRRRVPTAPFGVPAKGEEPVFAAIEDDLVDLRPDEALALAEDVDLSDRVRRRILAVQRRFEGADLFAVLGVGPEAERREIKRAYFRISKEFHPDRHYGQRLGGFAARLSYIFETATAAFETLSDRRRRQAYEARLRGGPAAGPASQTREEHAAELFDQACRAEVAGDRVTALKLFAAVNRIAPQARTLRRAARCAAGAGELSVAEEYAKQAADLRPRDPSYARVLADVYRAADKLELAEDTLVYALQLESDNDVLMGELQADLAAVRAARSRVG